MSAHPRGRSLVDLPDDVLLLVADWGDEQQWLSLCGTCNHTRRALRPRLLMHRLGKPIPPGALLAVVRCLVVEASVYPRERFATDWRMLRQQAAATGGLRSLVVRANLMPSLQGMGAACMSRAIAAFGTTLQSLSLRADHNAEHLGPMQLRALGLGIALLSQLTSLSLSLCNNAMGLAAYTRLCEFAPPPRLRRGEAPARVICYMLSLAAPAFQSLTLVLSGNVFPRSVLWAWLARAADHLRHLHLDVGDCRCPDRGLAPASVDELFGTLRVLHALRHLHLGLRNLGLDPGMPCMLRRGWGGDGGGNAQCMSLSTQQQGHRRRRGRGPLPSGATGCDGGPVPQPPAAPAPADGAAVCRGTGRHRRWPSASAGPPPR